MNARENKQNKYYYFQNDFFNSLSLVSFVEKRYKSKNFEEALVILQNGLKRITITSFAELSVYFDIIASILWKIGKRENAYKFWKKSYETDKTNRRSELSLRLLFNNEDKRNYYQELFIRLKFNEYFSNKKLLSLFGTNENFVLSYLTNFWERNIVATTLEKYDELELVDYFIKLKVFKF
ncbi:MAG TPA: hypothetical protein P5322_00790 [Spirochaetota bacterium]|nr:hypothetical protein [Spirochaetota bacterium]